MTHGRRFDHNPEIKQPESIESHEKIWKTKLNSTKQQSTRQAQSQNDRFNFALLTHATFQLWK